MPDKTICHEADIAFDFDRTDWALTLQVNKSSNYTEVILELSSLNHYPQN